MSRDSDVERAIRQRNVLDLRTLMFQADGTPTAGFRTEGELWDYKADAPRLGKDHIRSWAEVARDVLGFHNHRGGALVFGITDAFTFSGTSIRLDSKLFNDQIRKFLGDRIWVEFQREFVRGDQRYLGIAIVPPRGAQLARFTTDGPDVKGRKAFEVGGSAVRDGDSTRTLSRPEADELSRRLAIPTLGSLYAVDKERFRVLAPDYNEFVDREIPCKDIEKALHDPRTSVTSVIGIGGSGKTALATWAVLRAYDRAQFANIVSITAKDRELTPTGIQALEPKLTSYVHLLDATLDVLGFPDEKLIEEDAKKKLVRELLENSNSLLFVDNLETVDDARIVQFLDDLPVGCRAITTSRRSSVRVAVRPVDIGTLTDAEGVKFIESLTNIPGLTYLSDLAAPERMALTRSCNGIPLAVRWTLSRATTPSEAVRNAQLASQSPRGNEELLEFCFRRVFDEMPEDERQILYVLALFNTPVPTEALLVGTKLSHTRFADSTAELLRDSVIHRVFNSTINDYAFTMLPIARMFVQRELTRAAVDATLRKRLADWYEARDVDDPKERLIIREMRQGKGPSDEALLDLATGAERRGDLDSATELYAQALQRNPGSWKAARRFAEFQRHALDNLAEALRLYEQAAANAPRRGPDRALIFREWGMLLRDSGFPDATDQAIEKFETAVDETPNDEIAVHALAHMLSRKGVHRRVIALLEPLAKHRNDETRRKTVPLLLKSYEATNELVKAAELRGRDQTW